MVRIYKAKVGEQEWYVPYKSASLTNWAMTFIDEKRHRRYIEYIKGGDTIFDVGATTGEYTIPASRLVGENGAVYAFEPEPACYACLVSNMVLHEARNVIAANAALSHKGGTLTLCSEPETVSGDTIVKRRARWKERRETQVEATTLDTFVAERGNIPKIDILKVTVNGYDPNVLRGAKETLPNVRLVVVQSFPEEGAKSFRYLLKQGFGLREGTTHRTECTKREGTRLRAISYVMENLG